MQRRQLPENWDAELPEYPADAKGIASRDSNQQVLNIVAQSVPWLIGGSSDLAPSNKSRLTFEVPETSNRTTAPAAISTLGSGSTRLALSATVCRSARSGRTRPDS
jgi:transketolase